MAGVEALATLEQAASDPEPLIAEHARWAIGQIEARHRGTQAGPPDRIPRTD